MYSRKRSKFSDKELAEIHATMQAIIWDLPCPENNVKTITQEEYDVNRISTHDTTATNLDSNLSGLPNSRENPGSSNSRQAHFIGDSQYFDTATKSWKEGNLVRSGAAPALRRGGTPRLTFTVEKEDGTQITVYEEHFRRKE
jgi:hypothetical protein